MKGAEPLLSNGIVDSTRRDNTPDAMHQVLDPWQSTTEKVVQSVVSIQFCHTRSFDSDRVGVSEATGFVVDAERGLILTNRHVVGSGPFWGYGIFYDHEEVDVLSVYRDPVHDFGFLKFDPKAIKHMPVIALELRPDLVKVGLEIRVVGNDAGEKLSILKGVISRLDRNAPEYDGGYVDFNTNYYQASAAACGGSSGSPVVDVGGKAVALQAGGRGDTATTDYFLPLDRPLRALKCLQEGRFITRGDIQCQFVLEPFEECRRLGLTDDWERQMREKFPEETSLLVAETVLPKGPSHNKIEEGDVLVKVNGNLIAQLIRLDEILDSSVNVPTKLLLLRGGEEVEVEVETGDLHKISPDRFVSVWGATFHALSYQRARQYSVACTGVYLCSASVSFQLATNSLVKTLDGKQIPDLDTFIEVAKAIPDKARVLVTSRQLENMHTLERHTVQVDRHWYKRMQLAVRNDETGLWDFTDLAEAVPPVAPVSHKAKFIQPHADVGDLIRSFVHVICTMPVELDGIHEDRKEGKGLVVDASKGLVVISRATVPYDLCDLSITIADSIVVEGKVVFLHPLHNYAIIQYNPRLVDAPVMSARLSGEELTQGASTGFIAWNCAGGLVHTPTTVAEILPLDIAARPSAPRYRAMNVDVIKISTWLGNECPSGVLVAKDGSVQALWLTYLASSSTKPNINIFRGFAAPQLLPVISQIQEGIETPLRMLPVEFQTIPVSEARLMGVSEKRIAQVYDANITQHRFFRVSKRTVDWDVGAVGDADTLLEGDIVLALNGSLVTCMKELDVIYSAHALDAVVVRDREEREMQLHTTAARSVETDRAISFCGAVFHRPHHAVRHEISKLFSEVYVSARIPGSPAYQYGIARNCFITHVNNEPTPDLDSFLKVVVTIPDNTYFRLKVVSFYDEPLIVTVKNNEHYFPTIDWIKDPSDSCGWRRVTYKGSKVVEGEELVKVE